MSRRRYADLYMLPVSMGIGFLAAAGAVFFRGLVEAAQLVFWNSGTGFLDQVMLSPWWLRLLLPTAAGLVVGPVIVYLVPEVRGSGIPEVILSVSTRQSTIRHRVTLVKAAVTGLLIGAGASVGREGPIVQIGASIGSSIARLFRLNPALRRVCLAAGAAAGISATFNAPIAGTLFAVEIILMDVEVEYVGHIMIASITGTVLSRIFWGEFPRFEIVGFELTHHWELGFYLLLGILAGLTALVFSRAVMTTDELFSRVRIPAWIKPALGGLLLGLIGLKLPHVMGVGYEAVNLSLSNSLPLQLALLILAGKILATSCCIGSGMSGGILAPSMVVGSVVGAALGLAADRFFPGLGLNPSDYALAGMGAVVAGTTLAPMTAILTIFELTYSYQIIVPLMVVCISSTLVVKLLSGYSIYEMKLIKSGANVVRGHDAAVLRDLQVGSFMQRGFDSLLDASCLREVVDRTIKSPYPHFVVVDREESMVGVLSLRDLRSSLDKYEELQDIVVAADLMTREVVTIAGGDSLEKAFDLFERHRVSFLPVVDPDDPRKVLGVLKKDDVIQAYEERVLKDRILSSS